MASCSRVAMTASDVMTVCPASRRTSVDATGTRRRPAEAVAGSGSGSCQSTAHLGPTSGKPPKEDNRPKFGDGGPRTFRAFASHFEEPSEIGESIADNRSLTYNSILTSSNHLITSCSKVVA